MNASTAVAIVNTHAEIVGAKRRIVVWCTYCVNELDPHWELPARVAPAHAQCFACGNPAREREGLCFVLVPDTHSSVA